jgi:hypothetical protein
MLLAIGVGVVANLNGEAFDLFVRGSDDFDAGHIEQGAALEPVDPQLILMTMLRAAPTGIEHGDNVRRPVQQFTALVTTAAAIVTITDAPGDTN